MEDIRNDPDYPHAVEVLHRVSLEQYDRIKELDEAEAVLASEFEELDMFLFGKDSRTYCIMVVSLLENTLKETFIRRWNIGRKKQEDEYFGGNGPLSSFAQRTMVAVGLNWLTPELRLEADLLRKIRNEFAHNHRTRELTDRRVSGYISSLPAHEEIFAKREMDNYAAALKITDKQDRLRLRVFFSCVRLCIAVVRRSKMIEVGLPPEIRRESFAGLTMLEQRLFDTAIKHCFRVARYGRFADGATSEVGTNPIAHDT